MSAWGSGFQGRAPSVSQISLQPLGSGESRKIVGKDWETQDTEVSGSYPEGSDNDPGYLKVIVAYWHSNRLSMPVDLSALSAAIGAAAMQGWKFQLRLKGLCCLCRWPYPVPHRSLSVGLGDCRGLALNQGLRGLHQQHTAVNRGWNRGLTEMTPQHILGTLAGVHGQTLSELMRILKKIYLLQVIMSK